MRRGSTRCRSRGPRSTGSTENKSGGGGGFSARQGVGAGFDSRADDGAGLPGSPASGDERAEAGSAGARVNHRLREGRTWRETAVAARPLPGGRCAGRSAIRQAAPPEGERLSLNPRTRRQAGTPAKAAGWPPRACSKVNGESPGMQVPGFRFLKGLKRPSAGAGPCLVEVSPQLQLRTGGSGV
jgi:hypothetical protein